MAILAYCIAEAEPAIEVPVPGLQQKQIRTVVESGLKGFVSDYALEDAASKRPLREAALEFNRILQAFLRQTAILPFRFPSLFAGEEEVSAFLQQHSGEYREDLTRVRNCVQMEVRLSMAIADIQPPGVSGAAYLKARQAHYHRMDEGARELYRAVAPLVRSWKSKSAADTVRCFFLVDRGLVDKFTEHMQSVALPGVMQARVSGPWPATEFLKES
jgi:hypothetical protein